MGTSGDRQGYKVFSINTTIRNPQRNTEFLETFVPFNGQKMDKDKLMDYLIELIKKGIYKFQIIPEKIKNKLDTEAPLNSNEVAELIKLNPQATGWNGRVLTQLRSLKDQGFLRFDEQTIKITKLGEELLANKQDASFVYTKAMLGLHYSNPCRKSVLNKAVPFLNTLFVIDEVNKMWQSLGNEPKGILKHEFGAFVLSMKDCDYKTAANNIIAYRKKYRFEPNENFFNEYLIKNNILPIAYKTLINDYPDEVFRKFEMTGLIVQHGKFKYMYYNLSQYNIEKVRALLELYKNYSFTEFLTEDEYYAYLSSLNLPWENDEKIHKKIVEAKATALKMTPDKSLPLEAQEAYLDRVFYTKALEKAVRNTDLNIIYKELLILAGKIKSRSNYNMIPEPLRLEYLLALAIGKKYGVEGLISNIIYNEEGFPLHCAPSGKCDIIYLNKHGADILEPTMQRNRNQILNSETTNVVRHIEKEQKETNLDYRLMMIAPYVHPDVISYFKYHIISDSAKILSITIERVVGLLIDNDTINELNDNFDNILDFFRTTPKEDIADIINSYSVNQNKIMNV